MRTAIDADQFREAWADDRVSLEDLGREFGRAASTLSNIARRLGLPRRKTGRKPAEVEAGVELTGGQWVPNGRGVMVWRRTGG